MPTIETGKHYWFRQVHEKIWRVCYICQDCDDNQRLVTIGIDDINLDDLDLAYFEFIEIEKPKD